MWHHYLHIVSQQRNEHWHWYFININITLTNNNKVCVLYRMHLKQQKLHWIYRCILYIDEYHLFLQIGLVLSALQFQSNPQKRFKTLYFLLLLSFSVYIMKVVAYWVNKEQNKTHVEVEKLLNFTQKYFVLVVKANYNKLTSLHSSKIKSLSLTFSFVCTTFILMFILYLFSFLFHIVLFHR